MKVRINVECDGPPIGTEIENPYAFRLVELGLAEPVDEEAIEKAAQREAYLERLRRNLEREAKLMLAQAEERAAVVEAERLSAFERLLIDGPEQTEGE